jgi:hypothetical protein
MTDDVTDETLYDLTPAERRALRGIAKGGWTGSPGQKVCDAMQDKTGVHWQSEACRGEERAYYGFSPADEALAVRLVARLDALPRRKRGTNTGRLAPGYTRRRPADTGPVERTMTDLRLDRAALREQVAMAIHTTVCKDTPCVPHQVDWLAVADTALAAVDQQRQETPA